MLRLRWLAVLTIVLVAVILVMIVVGFGPWHDNPISADQEILFQVSAFEPFARGNYDGSFTFAQLAEHGDFGMGTIKDLDGEMIALDGNFYQIPVSGVPRKITSQEITPFAAVSFFNSDQSISVTGPMNYSELKTLIDEHIPDKDGIYLVKISGTFENVQTRSVPKQTFPYPDLYTVVENQTVFNLEQVEGTAAGFLLPSYMDGVNIAGYHLHFITDDITAGGHLLECNIKNVTIELDLTSNYELALSNVE